MLKARLSSPEPDFIVRTACTINPEFANLSGAKQQRWTHLMLSVMFRHMSYKELLATSREEYPGLQVKATWRATLADGYLMKNVKAWIFYCVKHSLRGAGAEQAARSFGVQTPELTLRYLSQGLRQHVQGLAQKYPALTVQQLDKHVVNIYRGIQDWLGKFVYRKMRFVYQQQGLTAHDLEAQIFDKGLHALYMTYPRISSALHAMNIVKAAAHNQGINLIKGQTHACRSRLVKGADNTFSSRVVSLHSVQETLELQTPDLHSVLEMGIDVSRIFNRYRLRGQPPVDPKSLMLNGTATPLSKKQLLMLLLMGYEDPQFNTWLKNTCHINSTSSEYLDRARTTRFLELALRYLQVDEAAGTRFVKNLRSQLRPYCNDSDKASPSARPKHSSLT